MPLNFTISIPDDQRSRVLDAFSARYGYTSEVPDGNGGMIPNPETRGQFAKRMLSDYVKTVVREAEIDSASRTAAASAAAAEPPEVT